MDDPLILHFNLRGTQRAGGAVVKIGFLSDTHGYYEHTKRALDILEGCDVVLHLGDILAPGPKNGIQPGYDPMALADLLANRDTIMMVKGNCDADVDEDVMQKKFLSNTELFVEAGELKIFASHGYRGTISQRIEKARRQGANAVAVGHTHVKQWDLVDEMVYLCPGSAAIPKDGTRSCIVYEDGVFNFYDVDTHAILRTVSLPKGF